MNRYYKKIKDKLPTLKAYRRNSVIMQIFIPVVVLMVSVICICVALWLTTYESLNQEKERSVNLSMIETTQNTLDLVLRNIEGTGENILTNKDVIAIGVSSTATDYQQVKSIQELLEISMEQTGVEDIFIYVHEGKKVITSQHTFSPLWNSEWESVIEFHENNWQRFPSFGESVLSTNRLEVVDNQLFMISDFPRNGKNSLLTVGILLDSNFLYEKVLPENIGESFEFYLFDRSGQVLMGSDKDTMGWYYSPENIIAFQEGVLENADDVYYQQSTYTGISFLMKHTISLPALLLANWNKLLPSLLFIILGSFIFSIHLVRKIYIPIQGLIALLFDDKNMPMVSVNHSGVGENEYDVIKGAYMDIKSNFNLMNHVVQSTKPVIYEKLFREIILGKRENIADADLLGITTFLRKDYVGAGKVVLILFEWSEQPEFVEEKTCYFLESIAEALVSKTFNQKIYCCNTCSISDEQVCVVISLNETEKRMDLHQSVATIVESILKEKNEIVLGRIHVAMSDRSLELEDIHMAYEEAVSNISTLKYLNTLKQGVAEGSQTDGQSNNEVQVLKEKLAFIFETQNDDDFAVIYNRCIESIDLFRYKNTNQSQKDGSLIFLDCLAEHVERERVFELDFLAFEAMWQKLYKMIVQEKGRTLSPETSKEVGYLIAYVQKEMNCIALKKSHKYMKVAIEAVQQNLRDPDFDLGKIAKMVDTNTTYLSKIFKEKSGMRFVDYLNQERIEVAKYLLKSTDLPVLQVAESTGFLSTQNFNKVFKKYVGVTPSQYKKHEEG